MQLFVSEVIIVKKLSHILLFLNIWKQLYDIFTVTYLKRFKVLKYEISSILFSCEVENNDRFLNPH